MLKNYLITAWRNITRDKYYALLNVAGLAMGLTAALFIFMYVSNEFGYDKSNINHKRIPHPGNRHPENIRRQHIPHCSPFCP